MNVSEAYALVSILRFKAENAYQALRRMVAFSAEWKALARRRGHYLALMNKVQDRIDEYNLSLAGY